MVAHKTTRHTPPLVDWNVIETILLDMDGTLLDLSFDNYFWRELIPRCMARAGGISQAVARDDLFARYAAVQGSLEWYCLDYWSDQLHLDLRQLKSAASQRVRFLPGAQRFLAHMTASGKRVVLVTNAHEDALAIKKDVAGLDRYIGEFISSHSIGFAKEHPEFWSRLQQQLDFSANTAFFADDSLPVLDAAARFGLSTIVAITAPASREAPVVAPDRLGAHRGTAAIVNLL